MGWSLPRRLRLGLAVALVLLAVAPACGDGGDGVRIIGSTGTPGATATAASSPGAARTPAGSPTAGPAGVPPRPDDRLTSGEAVARHIAGGQADIEGCLPELVRAWELADVEGERCLLLDIDGDGQDELLFVAAVPDGEQPPGDVWIFDDLEGETALLTSARPLANQLLFGLALDGSADVTGDGVPEVVVTAEECGAHTCITRFIIISNHRQRLENLAPGGSAIESLESIEFADADGDGLADIIVRGGTVAAEGAGPQRAVTRTLAWNGAQLTQSDVRDEPEYLFHLVVDADEAFRLNDLQLALELYERAATDTRLRDWKAEVGDPDGRSELAPYAWFRAAMTAQLLGDDEAMGEYLLNAAEHEDSLHGGAAGAYLEALADGDRPAEACAAAKAYLEQSAEAYQRAWDYGYTNPPHQITALCA